MKQAKNLFKLFKEPAILMLSIGIFGIIIYMLPFTFIPDWLHIKSYTKIYELFNLIISSLTTMIGIYISVSLIAFELLRQKSGLDLHNIFLINKINSFYISISVSTILFAFFCSISLSLQNPSYNEVTVIYFNIILFCSNILLLFFVAFQNFINLKPEKIINEQILKIDRNTILIKISENDDYDKREEKYENDHLLNIQNILVEIIASGNRIKAQTIIMKVSKKVSELIVKENNEDIRRYISQRLVSFYIDIIDFILSQPNNSFLLNSVWETVQEIYSLSIKKKETAIHFQYFRKLFFERYFTRLFEYNKEEVIKNGIITINKIIEEQLDNMPIDEKIFFLDIYRRNFDQNFTERDSVLNEEEKLYEKHWKETAIELTGLFPLIINKSISKNKPEIIQFCFEQMHALNFRLHLNRIGIYKEMFLYSHFINIICDYTYIAFQKNIFLEGVDARNSLPTLFIETIRQKHPAARNMLQKYCNLLIKLQKINKLDRWLLGGLSVGNSLFFSGELGDIAESCATKYKEGIEFKEYLSDCIDTFKILKELYEEKLPENFDLYLLLKKRLEGILLELTIFTLEDERIITNIKELISSFHKEV